jgi:hypothetical protein
MAVPFDAFLMSHIVHARAAPISPVIVARSSRNSDPH